MATERRRDERARIFTIGAAYGFVAGVFAMTLLVWQFGDLMATRAAARLDNKPRAVGEAVDEPDVDKPVIETPPPAATTGSPSTIGPPLASELKNRNLEIPVEGVRSDQLTRQFDDARGGRRHEAIDILAPHGTPVKAVEDGEIARLFQSKAGGITIYQFDPTDTYCYYYAHLDRYAAGLREGDRVRRGQVIGYVGVTGNAPKNTPHLHFAVFRLNEQKRWWEGTPIDPYDVLR
jgi:murein DD-endopeptidase MepM/ murein hydrolase activator NlpD